VRLGQDRGLPVWRGGCRFAAAWVGIALDSLPGNGVFFPAFCAAAG
jgi:hypothetical protein